MGDPVGYDGEHIWLRQSITQTVQGQTRTLEIGVSVRPGMTADQIEALLREADAGMQRLSRHLEDQMAGPNGRSAGKEAPRPESPRVEPKPVEAIPVEPRAMEPKPAEPRPVEPRPVEPRPVESRPAPRVPADKPSLPPARVGEEEPEEPREPLSVKDFLDAARAEMNLNPKQAMSALNVRSLSGLNLREALETLRRQSLGAASGTAAPRGGPAPVPATPSAPPRYFEEEDEGEFEVTLTFDEDDEDSEDGIEEEDPDELEDVPDFDTELATSGAKIAPVSGEPARATQIIGQLRQAAGGGTPTPQQRVAYRNIILHELGDQPAKALVQGLWRVGADKLSAEQLDALLSWGKRETFGEEAELVLKALRTEREEKSRDGGETRPPRRAVPPRGGS